MYIGIDLGGTNLKGSLFSENFEWVETIVLPSEADKGAGVVIEHIHQLIELLLAKSPEQVLSIGIGVPRLLDKEAGISRFSPNFTNWENVPVTKLVHEKFQIPTFIDNDVRVNLYGEWHFGAGKEKENVVLLTLGTGVGAGIVVDNHVLYGKTGSAGEVGHMNMYREGRPCKCGSSGCFSRYVSATGIVMTAKEKLGTHPDSLLAKVEDLTTKMISDAYDQGDQLAIEIYQETGELLGFGLGNILNLYNPEILIIGGGVSKAGERLLAYARETVAKHSLQISYDTCEIVTASLSDKAGMIGAAYYGANQLIERLA